MTSTYQSADLCSYEEKLRRSVGPGMYQLSRPANDCGDACNSDINPDPYLRYQTWGPTTCPPGSSVDDNSELSGLNYKNSKCSSDSYTPGKYPNRGACSAPGKSAARTCMAPTETTRLSNPPCTLKSTGWNRWEWLCWDPQERAIIPFEWNTSYRIVAKDNHGPIIEEPIDQSVFFPKAKEETLLETANDWYSKSVCKDSDTARYAQYNGDTFNASAFSCEGIK